MSGTRARTATITLIVIVLVMAFSATTLQAANAPVRSIVMFQPGARSAALGGLSAMGGARIKDLPLINGAVVMMPDKAAQAAAARMPGIRYIGTDTLAFATAKPVKPAPVQTLPWGIDRIEAEKVWTTTTGDPVKVGIVDTGIDTSHPDLAANIKGGMSAVSYTTKYTDDNGHGTHVAGITAALNNTIGVVGVGPDIDLYAVKVLNRKGSGYISDIIEGLGWCKDNGMDVVNMSLGASAYDAAFDQAVTALYQSGTVIVAAAGNDGIGSAVNYPAAFDEVIAVSATDSSDALASFTCTGPQVELAAPGVSIYSTYKGSTYATLSGTSMASPHVTGVAALVLTTPVGASDADGDGEWDPAEVRARLRATAQDLGPTGWDSGYGYGLVRADLAVAQ